MQKKSFWLAAAVLLPLGVLAAALSTANRAAAQSGTRTDTRPFEQRFWDWLQANQYRRWARPPGQTGDFAPGESPHGSLLRTYLNSTAAANLKSLPQGSVIVKENYNDARQLMAITVMYRAQGFDPPHRDWYWVKYMPNGAVATALASKGGMKLAGRVQSCINCHDGADGNDMAFVND